MTRISSALLNDTFNMVALAREAARARGGQEQADRLSPMEDGLRELVSGHNSSLREPIGALAQEDFKTLLAAVQREPVQGEQLQGDRHQVAGAMAAGGMNEVDIARHLGISQESVRVILNLNQSGGAGEGLR
ncbi:MAG: hypothetical protein JXA97_07350 [Anaerolineales bacterium]|nr:hypothetical protein [Anaerolineales bacterium]